MRVFLGAVANRERSSTPFTEDEVEDAEARKTIADCKLRIAKAEQVKQIEDEENIIILKKTSSIIQNPITGVGHDERKIGEIGVRVAGVSAHS